MTSDDNPHLPSLPSLGDALREAQEGLQRVQGPRGLEELPLTVRLIREARAKRQMKKALKERRFQERKLKRGKHYTQKMKKRRDRHFDNLWNFFQHWKHQPHYSDRSQMTYEMFCQIWGRVAPFKTGKTLWEYSKNVRCQIRRKDPEKPWTLENTEPWIYAGGRRHRWDKLEKVPAEMFLRGYKKPLVPRM